MAAKSYSRDTLCKKIIGVSVWTPKITLSSSFVARSVNSTLANVTKPFVKPVLLVVDQFCKYWYCLMKLVKKKRFFLLICYYLVGNWLQIYFLLARFWKQNLPFDEICSLRISFDETLLHTLEDCIFSRFVVSGCWFMCALAACFLWFWFYSLSC